MNKDLTETEQNSHVKAIKNLTRPSKNPDIVISPKLGLGTLVANTCILFTNQSKETYQFRQLVHKTALDKTRKTLDATAQGYGYERNLQHNLHHTKKRNTHT